MSDDHNIETWGELDQRLSKLGLHIEGGALNWVSRIIDHADKLKAERDAAEAKLEKAMQVVEMIASADVDAVLGEAVDISCEIIGELMEEEDDAA